MVGIFLLAAKEMLRNSAVFDTNVRLLTFMFAGQVTSGMSVSTVTQATNSFPGRAPS